MLSTKRYYDSQIYALCGGGALLPSGGCDCCERRSQRNRAPTRKGQKRAIIFILATGEPNACGRGCTEWIAGEGQFDESAAQRFRDFLAALPKRDLPIFFNSDGGLLREAVQIGLILRENRMTAGVARTVPEGCHLGIPIGDACRRLMQSKRDHKAKLYFGGARCGSACVYAMVGASTRHVDPGATLRIHSAAGREIDKTENFLRRYVTVHGRRPGPC